MSKNNIEQVAKRLRELERVAIAVSGGIDSLTLATIAGRYIRGQVKMYHAISPAVPAEATRRVEEMANNEGWELHFVDAAEFARKEYTSNPVNRCFYCKQSLYSTIVKATSGRVLSGTNADDLYEYRPGLDAAREWKVCHPYAELGIGKDGIRSMARSLGLGEMSELPSSPCLSSRVETGIAITPELLKQIHAAENEVRRITGAKIVRCRYREGRIVIEIGEGVLSKLEQGPLEDARNAVRSAFDVPEEPVSFSAYRTGSAFLVPETAGGEVHK